MKKCIKIYNSYREFLDIWDNRNIKLIKRIGYKNYINENEYITIKEII
jgi:hypothetical protein